MKSLGSYADHPPRDRFGHAKSDAEKYAREVDRGMVSEERLETVEDACRRLAASHKEAGDRFRRHVYSDPIAKVKLTKLRKAHLASWRARLQATPALVSRRKKGVPITRPRSPATVNRDVSVLRMALGAVLPLGPPNTEAAWQEALKPEKNAVRRRTLYLNKEQRRALVEAVDSEAAPFVRALCMLPLRPGAVAALTVGDFDKQTAELTICKDKAGRGRRIVVPKVAARLFASAAKGKPSTAPLFTMKNGRAWHKEYWRHPIRDAATAAKLPPNVIAYTLRHSTITDLVMAGLPLLTIAQISGTSAEMIEKHYGHLARNAATKALASLAV